MSGVSIKVGMRCRPFTYDDDLGVHMIQNGEEEGEVNLINTEYTTTRFAFAWSWWSAHNWKVRCKKDIEIAESMKFTKQTDVYTECGEKIKADLLGGNAVVMFAYGLSGSGKTYTVFGPDAVDIPEAWFKHAEPHDQWGVFPRLAYDIFKMKEDGWKISMKYFQNVVDTVRDLMSPMATEKMYKEGMRKDKDGFTDIEWCQSAVLKDWNDLRTTFQVANKRKAIAPTQFNPQSTRGHCIMTFEVEKPDPDNPDLKQKGRLYVCDLAGTEPAGEIVYAQYKKVTMSDGSIENVYQSPHPDNTKSKELQDQGKKINLSLTEMAQFFMKMAEACQKKKLKPGASIPGCNSFFLCKYLKDTMLQARTYLFCAIRPELKYKSYTFSTLGFAKNASVVKLQPKKATVAMSKAERKLMEELEKLKSELEQYKNQGIDQNMLNQALAAKQAELANQLEGGGGEDSAKAAEEAMMAKQRDEYGRRGVS